MERTKKKAVRTAVVNLVYPTKEIIIFSRNALKIFICFIGELQALKAKRFNDDLMIQDLNMVFHVVDHTFTIQPESKTQAKSKNLDFLFRPRTLLLYCNSHQGGTTAPYLSENLLHHPASYEPKRNGSFFWKITSGFTVSVLEIAILVPIHVQRMLMKSYLVRIGKVSAKLSKISFCPDRGAFKNSSNRSCGNRKLSGVFRNLANIVL
uniref:Uncharacterized protein n=1 Tax=Romanomermis culicivorax TaxID=13658 RepID=A0A915HQT6_ROMCU